ncbi:MAG: serine/threonine phosphatase PrpC, regulation of stationary phase, partial [Myxococcaceae bacterium]|nr:serine/threonine phosphatase PrpC, regulation of stationary phase [Myxococcaceae bacterium]
YALSDTGKVRKHNEDSFCTDEELGLYVVCDGMGGHAAGEVASKTAVNAIVRVIYEQREAIASFDGSHQALEQMIVLLHQAISEASRTVYEVASSDRGKHGMGTTCVALLVLGDKAVMGTVGDSRVYLARDQRIDQLSTDHNFMTEVVASGMMSPEQAAEALHANVLTRAVGVQPTVKVDVLAFDVLRGDTFLLCSDGLYDYWREPAELAQALRGADVAAVARSLVTTALEGGGHDNATALVVRVVSQEPRQRERKTAVTSHLDALREIELFRDFTLAELVNVYNELSEVHAEVGEQPIREGDRGEHLYVIVEGRCQVAREGQAIAVLGAGAHFGEMALLNQRPRSATVTALDRTRLLRLDRAGFHALMAREPAIGSKFLWKFAQTLSLRLDDTYLARDFRSGRTTLGLAEYPSLFDKKR